MPGNFFFSMMDARCMRCVADDAKLTIPPTSRADLPALSIHSAIVAQRAALIRMRLAALCYSWSCMILL